MNEKGNNGTLVYYLRNYFDYCRTGPLFYPRYVSLVWQASGRYPNREGTQQSFCHHHLYAANQYHPDHSGESDPVAVEVKESQRFLNGLSMTALLAFSVQCNC